MNDFINEFEGEGGATVAAWSSSSSNVDEAASSLISRCHMNLLVYNQIIILSVVVHSFCDLLKLISSLLILFSNNELFGCCCMMLIIYLLYDKVDADQYFLFDTR